MPSWDKELLGALTGFYDCHSYRRMRHVEQLDIIIERPQVSILGGTTPANLLTETPSNAWGQGFMSRVVLIYSNEKIIGDDFAQIKRELPEDMVSDLAYIFELKGQFKVTPEYQRLVNEWRANKERPHPRHPKLDNYISRRRTLVYKLSMVHSVDRGNSLVLDADDFHMAMKWLGEAELNMEAVFSEARSLDAQGIAEVISWLETKRAGVTQEQLVRRVSQIFPGHAVLKIIDLMAMSGQIEKDDNKRFSAKPGLE